MMDDFRERLARAVQRGQKISTDRVEAEAHKEMSQAELKRLHRDYRLQLTEHIERSINELPNHLPGFQIEPVLADRGWGSAASRDDLSIDRVHGRRNFFSRMELVVRPVSDSFVLDILGKGTIRNKEVFNRSFFQLLSEVDMETFRDTIDHWILEYAQRYAAD
jgi:hypothetical protein